MTKEQNHGNSDFHGLEFWEQERFKAENSQTTIPLSQRTGTWVLPPPRLRDIQEQHQPGRGQAIPWAPAPVPRYGGWGGCLCFWNGKVRKGQGKLLSKPKSWGLSSEAWAAPFAKREMEKRQKALDGTGSGGRYVVTGGGRSYPSLAAGAWNFLLAGRAHPPRNGKQSLASGPPGIQGFDNQALFSSLPHPSPAQRGKPRQAGSLSKPRTPVAPWQIPVIPFPDRGMSGLRQSQGRGLGQAWQGRWELRPERAVAYPKSPSTLQQSLLSATKADF